MSLLKQPIIVVNAPSNLGLKPPAPGREPGTRRAPQALCESGLLSAFQCPPFNTVFAPPYQPEIDPVSRVRNGEAIARYSYMLAHVVNRVLETGAFPLVLGGDCSILLGNILALRRRGEYGLIFIDGHTDFQTPQTSATGGAAGMDLALVCGVGTEQLTTLYDPKPLVKTRNVVALGFRDMQDRATYYAPDIFDTNVALYPLDRVREMSIERAVSEVVQALVQNGIEGFWIHVDVDVLDSEFMPAVDSPQPGGMSGAELSRLLRALLASDYAVGLEVTIFDPDLDPDGTFAKRLVEIIVQSFAEST